MKGKKRQSAEEYVLSRLQESAWNRPQCLGEASHLDPSFFARERVDFAEEERKLLAKEKTMSEELDLIVMHNGMVRPAWE